MERGQRGASKDTGGGGEREAARGGVVAEGKADKVGPPVSYSGERVKGAGAGRAVLGHVGRAGRSASWAGAGLQHAGSCGGVACQKQLCRARQCAGGGADWAPWGAMHACQLNSGASSSVAGALTSLRAHGGGNNDVFIGGLSSGAGGGGGRRRANSSLGAASRRRQRANASNRGGGRGRGVAVEEVEDLGSSGGPPGKPYLKKVLKGPPANLDYLEEMFRGNTVDGSIAFVPGDDYGEGQEGAADEWAEEVEENYVKTPRSTSSQKSKRSLGSTTSTFDSPVKKSKSPMIRYVKDISITFKEPVQVKNKEMLKCAGEKEVVSVKRCQQLAFECGIEQTSDVVFVVAKMFQDPF
ncbi:hypothetical protein C2845_PM15G05410 [Panicum miliaceum]|uniref:Uncharacterized protein n=1 Tax=Panicum miliaceum TaxID=4540 RepID=A0A3L6Q385_PANMI|nr:hypothetical protein C2845_PM15G05410 [Panicum miliaceum]